MGRTDGEATRRGRELEKEKSRWGGMGERRGEKGEGGMPTLLR